MTILCNTNYRGFEGWNTSELEIKFDSYQMYFIIKCRDTKCHGTSVGNFHAKYHVEPNRVRHWAQQILQVTGSTNAYSGVQAVFLLLFISQVELVKPKVEPADDHLFQLGINLQKYLNKTPR